MRDRDEVARLDAIAANQNPRTVVATGLADRGNFERLQPTLLDEVDARIAVNRLEGQGVNVFLARQCEVQFEQFSGAHALAERADVEVDVDPGRLGLAGQSQQLETPGAPGAPNHRR